MCLPEKSKSVQQHAAIFPASHYVVPQEQIKRAADAILEEMKEQVAYFKSEDKLLEAQRIAERTNFDVEMMRETGFCSGIENYSRHLTGLAAGAAPIYADGLFSRRFPSYHRRVPYDSFHRSAVCMPATRAGSRLW